tara:strand:+ start:1286 stop:1501 length:216 start_codon:yes stop_codon:yes gene_type:complete
MTEPGKKTNSAATVTTTAGRCSQDDFVADLVALDAAWLQKGNALGDFIRQQATAARLELATSRDLATPNTT